MFWSGSSTIGLSNIVKEPLVKKLAFDLVDRRLDVVHCRENGLSVATVELEMLPHPNWNVPPGRKRKFWREMVKEDLRQSALIGGSTETKRFAGIANRWLGSVRAVAENRTG
ncbi:hypothetical protein RB195_014304 [Necator americanus]|uniref:Uncharacterized protein n=1 Tax=Necator americanus TaxID=51031 RepID=A0ABR1E132_NECAM